MDMTLNPSVLRQDNTAAQHKVLAQYDELRAQPLGWKVCIQQLPSALRDDQHMFFLMNVVDDFIRSRYETAGSEDQLFLKQFFFSWMKDVVSTRMTLSTAIENKFALLVTNTFMVDFPAIKWGTFFSEFLSNCINDRTCILFLKILQQINIEIADKDLNKSSKELEKSTLIKDMMRDVCMMDLATFWFNTINSYKESCPAVVTLCLDVVGAYVSWIDITLVTNDQFMTKLLNLFDNPVFRSAVCDCFSCILHKKMDPLIKVQMIEQFMNVDAIKQRLRKIVSRTDDTIRDDTFYCKLSKLVNTIGLELVDSFKKVKTRPDLVQHLPLIGNQIEDKFGLMCFFLSDKEFHVSFQVHPFAREYIQWVKNNRKDLPDQKPQEIITIVAKMVMEQSKYPTGYDYEEEDDAEFDEFRKSCKMLFENIMLIDATACVNFILTDLVDPVLINWKSGQFDFRHVEVSLFMLYSCGENLNNLSHVSKRMEETLTLLITSNVSNFPHPSIQVTFFELIIRYDKFLTSSISHLIPQILMAFLDERGFKNTNYRVRSRACNIFNRFIRTNSKGKACEKIQGFAEEMIKRLHDFLRVDSSEVTTHSPLYLSDEDQLVLFETVASLIVINSSYDVSKKFIFLKTYLIEPMWNSFEDLLMKLTLEVASTPKMNGGHNLTNGHVNPKPVNPKVTPICAKISHVIFLVARTSKAFTPSHPMKSIGAQTIYVESFNNFVKVLSMEVGPDNLSLLQSSLRQLIHRLIVTMDESEILPLLPVAIDKMFLPISATNLNEKTVQELIPLIIQIVTKFKLSWLFQRDIVPFLNKMFMPLVSAIFELTSKSDVLSSDEIQSLQKCYYSFVSCLALNNVFDVFKTMDWAAMNTILMSVVHGSVNFPDVAVQKNCFTILRKMVEYHHSGLSNGVTNGNAGDIPPNGVANGPAMNGGVQPNAAFVEFLYTQIVPSCFYCSLSLTESEVNQLLNEIMLTLKTITNHRGRDEFSSFLQNQFFVQHFTTFSDANNLIISLMNNQDKLLKESYRKFVSQFKRSDSRD